ncbi:MAG: putative metal-binding motif-containing protein [Myxococcota bacterium]
MKTTSLRARVLVLATGLVAAGFGGCISVERKPPGEFDASGDLPSDGAGDLSGDFGVDAADTDGTDAADDGASEVDGADGSTDIGHDGDGDADALGDVDGDTETDASPDADVEVDGDAEIDGGAKCDPFDLTSCDDENPCTRDQCDSTLGCLHIPDNALPCDDGTPCTVGDTCQDGTCTGGDEPDCDDGNACTDDYCEEGSGECMHEPIGDVECDFDGPCSESVGVCVKGECVGVPVTCPANGDPCKSNVCQPGSGCVVKNLNGTPCDDGDPCTSGDSCAAGVCKGKAGTCNDANPCTLDTCDPGNGKCSNTPDNGATCTAAAGCDSVGICSGSTCVATAACDCAGDGDCDDGNECTVGVCKSGTCEYQDVAGACDDGDACTIDDECVSGVCTAALQLSCDDGNECTSDACNSASGCDYTLNPVPCDDDNECTVGETCQAGAGASVGVCKGGTARACDDGDECTTDGCDPAAGCLRQAVVDACGPASADTCSVTLCQPTAGSAKTCTQLGWSPGLGSPDVCGASEVPACSGLKTFAQAKAICEAAGARLCTWTEVTGNEAAQSGCNYDAERVWTSTACGTNSALTQAGGSSGFAQVMSQCTLKAATAYVRCCADASAGAQLPMCTQTVKPGPCDDGDACTLNDRCQPGGCVGDALNCSGLDSACSTGSCVGGACQKTILSGAPCSTTDMCIVAATCDETGTCTGSYDGQKPGCSCKAPLCPGAGTACSESDISEGCKSYYKDVDGDGHGDPNQPACSCSAIGKYTATVADDCNDAEGAAWTNATERCDGVDNNCNGQTDETFTTLGKACDGDDSDLCTNGTTKCATAGTGTTCVETGAGIAEECNGVDDDCDGKTDEGFVTVAGKPVGAACDGADTDKCLDDIVICQGGAAVCSVGDNTVEVCDSGFDDDCDGVTDEEGAVGCKLYYLDSDGDGFGNSGLCLCAKDGDYTALMSSDCDDNDGDVFPSQAKYFGVPRMNPGFQPAFDYNCDGIETKQYETKGSSVLLSCKLGWADSIPECGEKGTYVTACTIGVFIDTDKERVQGCR